MYGIFWLVAFGVFLVIEMITLGLTTIWFACGSLVALIIALLGAALPVQIIGFLVVSAVMLFFTRPVAAKYLNSKTTKTNAEGLVGKNARVTQTVNNLKAEGTVVINGMEWTARSTKDEVTFKPEEIVRIAGISGVKLIIEKLAPKQEEQKED